MTRLAAIAALAAAGASGCGAGGGKAEPARPAATTAAAAPRLAGDYVRDLTRANLERTNRQRRAGPGQDPPEPGRLRLSLGAGTLTLHALDEGVTVRQDFSATSDGSLRIGAYQDPAHGSFCGPEVAETATYAWRMAEGRLSLRAVQDGCADRDALIAGSWRRRPG